MTPLEKLDYVLEGTHDERDYFRVYEDLGKDEKLSVDKHNLNMILNKLQRDGYVDFKAGERYVTGQQASEGMSIRRNFDGDLFLEAGGYTEEARQKSISISAIEMQNRRTERNERLLTRWTAAVALGAIGLVLWEIYKTFFLHF